MCTTCLGACSRQYTFNFDTGGWNHRQHSSRLQRLWLGDISYRGGVFQAHKSHIRSRSVRDEEELATLKHSVLEEGRNILRSCHSRSHVDLAKGTSGKAAKGVSWIELSNSQTLMMGVACFCFCFSIARALSQPIRFTSSHISYICHRNSCPSTDSLFRRLWMRSSTVVPLSIGGGIADATVGGEGGRSGLPLCPLLSSSVAVWWRTRAFRCGYRLAYGCRCCAIHNQYTNRHSLWF